MLDLSVPAIEAGKRLDLFLAAVETSLSRSGLQTLIRAGRVRVNGRVARPSLKVKDGDRVSVELPPPRRLDLEPEPLPLAVLHEDEHLLVIDKPAGMAVHPGAGRSSGTLVHALLHRYPEIEGVGGAGRPGIVHRLDKDTTGLMVVARSQRAYLALVDAMQARSIRRIYDALVWGEPRASHGSLATQLGRDPRERKRIAVLTRGGRPARTHWRVAERFRVATLLSVSLDTGRTHQIRVHLAHLGHPVVGDPVYGGRAKKQLSPREPGRSLPRDLLMCLRRQALHASELALAHPVTGKPLAFASPWPEDLAQAVGLLRAARAGGQQ